MLDLFAIFTRGGALLWTLQFTSLRHSPIEALNALVKSCLLEERSGETTFTFVPKNGAHQALKWTFHNGLGLVFVAAYQKALSVLYVDELLASVKQEFTTRHYKPNVLSYPEFTDSFQRLYRECEARADERKAAGPPVAAAPVAPGQAAGKTSAAGAAAQGKGGAAGGAKAGAAAKGGNDEDEEEDGEEAQVSGAPLGGSGGEEDAATSGAFDLSKIKGKGGPRGARPGKPPVTAAGLAAAKKKEEKDAPKKKEKTLRTWGTLGGGGGTRGSENGGRIDYTDDPSEFTAGSESDRQGGYSDVDGASARNTPATNLGVSLVDLDSDAAEEDSVSRTVREAEALLATSSASSKGAAAAAGAKPKGLLGGFMSSLAMRVVGKGSLTVEDLAPALQDMKRKLMEKNVAEEIAQSVTDSVSRSLEGQKLASFTGMGTFVARAFEDALSGILHKRTVDMLLDIRKSQERGKPYVVVFCGVNGVGKSTNLAKIAYWLGQHGVKVLIAACDTFRAGAVEQLKTHCARLQVPLYERGYEKDPAKVASEAIKQAEREGRHVVLVDTAGRMQDNEPLMRALSNLINMNNPNLVLFVGEALVGNDAVDQLVKFNRALHDLAPPTATRHHVIDGIVLTKFDTIDDKVGAAVSMVYASGAPIMFLGCGQTYADLKRLNVKSVVNSLLK